MRYQYVLPLLLDEERRASVEEETRRIFATMLETKKSSIELYKRLNYRQMALGESVCHRYAVVFAVRNLLGLDLPVVIDSEAYGHLDPELSQGFHAFVNRQNCQRILLCSENGYVDTSDADYLLE